MFNVSKFIYGVGLTIVFAMVLSTAGRAQLGDVSDVDPNTGIPVATESQGVTAAANTINAITGANVTGAGLAATAADITTAFNLMNSQITQITGSIIETATQTAESLDPESNKIAGGLAVIVIVLTFVEFAGTHHPVGAWVKAFQSLFVLGMFAAVYVGYATAAPGFYTYFVTIAKNMNGGLTVVQSIGAAAGSVWLGIVNSFAGASLSQLPQIFVIDVLALLCLAIICLAGIVFLYYTLLGAVQSAIGIVFGKLAIALGFHRMTRGFFSSWLGFMVHSGMLTAVSAAINALVISQFVSTLQVPNGGLNFTTSLNTVVTFLCSCAFILLLSIEVPKIAGMFGSGGASGGPRVVGQLVSDARKRLSRKDEDDAQPNDDSKDDENKTDDDNDADDEADDKKTK